MAKESMKAREVKRAKLVAKYGSGIRPTFFAWTGNAI